MIPVPTRRLAVVALVLAAVRLVLPDDLPGGLVALNAALVVVALADWAVAVRPGAVRVERVVAAVVPLGAEAPVQWRLTNTTDRPVRCHVADELAPLAAAVAPALPGRPPAAGLGHRRGDAAPDATRAVRADGAGGAGGRPARPGLAAGGQAPAGRRARVPAVPQPRRGRAAHRASADPRGRPPVGEGTRGRAPTSTSSATTAPTTTTGASTGRPRPVRNARSCGPTAPSATRPSCCCSTTGA